MEPSNNKLCSIGTPKPAPHDPKAEATPSNLPLKANGLVPEKQPGTSTHSPEETTYWNVRNKKLEQQAAVQQSSLFLGCQFYLNGYLGKSTPWKLTKLIQANGGKVRPMINKHTTHIICTNLSGSKAHQRLQVVKFFLLHFFKTELWDAFLYFRALDHSGSKCCTQIGFCSVSTKTDECLLQNFL